MACRLVSKLFTVLALVALAAETGSAADQGHDFTYSGSLQFSTGKYLFYQRTNSFYFYNGLQYNAKLFSLSATIPLVLQDSPWLSNSGVGLIPSGGIQHKDLKQAVKQGKLSLPDTASYNKVGLGDPVLHFNLDAVQERTTTPGISFTADLKIPISDVDNGFGTGEWDYAAGLSLFKTFERTMLFLDGSYWVIGDLPYLELKDTVAFGFSVGRLYPGKKIGLIASITGNTSTQAGFDAPLQVGIGVNQLFETGSGLSGSINFGLTETAPDISVSLGYHTGL